MASTRTLLPVDEPYQARVLVGFLSQAFNSQFGMTRDVPPLENPLWPTAVRLVEALNRGGYRLAATCTDGQYTPHRDHTVTMLRHRT